MRYVKKIWIGAVLLMLAACGKGDDDAFAEATPDLAGLSLEISGQSEGAALSYESEAQKLQQGLHGEAPEYLKNAREAVITLNAQVKKIVEPIAELIAAGAGKSAPGDSKVFGPKDKGNVTYKLTLKRQSMNRFGWKLEGKPVGGNDAAYKVIAAGALTKGEQPHRGRGSIGIDLDVLKSIDSTFKGQGKLLCGFAHVNDTKTLVYLLKGFTPDVALHAPVSAAFVGHRLMPSRATRVRMASLTNLADSPTAAKELVRARVRYVPGVGGRADILATGGDVPVAKVYFGSACWDAQEHEGFAILRLCDRGNPASCVPVATRGSRNNCKQGLTDEELPPEGAEDMSLEPEAPASDVNAPAVMPDGAGG